MSRARANIHILDQVIDFDFIHVGENAFCFNNALAARDASPMRSWSMTAEETSIPTGSRW